MSWFVVDAGASATRGGVEDGLRAWGSGGGDGTEQGRRRRRDGAGASAELPGAPVLPQAVGFRGG
jgi:hypothetical protein